MRRFIFCRQGHVLIALLGALLAMTFLVFPAMAQEMTSAQKLEKAKELSVKASEMAAWAKEMGDPLLADEALKLAKEASVLLLGIAARDTGDAALAKSVLDVASATSSVVSEIATMAKDTSNPYLAGDALDVAGAMSGVISEIAAVAEATDNVDLAGDALDVVNTTSETISGIADMAKATGNTKLAQASMNAANNLGTAINEVRDAATFIARTSTDTEVVDDAKRIIARAEKISTRNEDTIKLAVAGGAVPGPPEAYAPPEAYVPPEAPVLGVPVQEEPPIQATEPASPI